MGFHNNKTGRYQLYSDSERKAYAQQQREANRQSIMSKWITVWRLKDERKWTDAAIKKYLGTPVEQNGYKVFPVSQIKQVEQSDAFQQWMLPGLKSSINGIAKNTGKISPVTLKTPLWRC